jgi:hypothetical protein
MFDADGRKLSIAEREAAQKLSIASLGQLEASYHWVVIERDKLREENTALINEKEALYIVYDTIGTSPEDFWEAYERITGAE